VLSRRAELETGREEEPLVVPADGWRLSSSPDPESGLLGGEHSSVCGLFRCFWK